MGGLWWKSLKVSGCHGRQPLIVWGTLCRLRMVPFLICGVNLYFGVLKTGQNSWPVINLKLLSIIFSSGIGLIDDGENVVSIIIIANQRFFMLHYTFIDVIRS